MAPFTISDNELSSLRGSVVIVTGGSSGIGLACVELLLAQGANVVIGDLEAPPSNILTGGAVFVPVDVTSWEQLKSMFEAAVGTFGGVDHVFANAGIAGRDDYVGDDLDDGLDPKEPSNLVIHINLIGVINTTRLAIHYLKKTFQRFSVVDYEAVARSVLILMADTRRNQQLIYSTEGIYTEIESDLLKAADNIRPKETSEEEDLYRLAKVKATFGSAK
ncbi:hypothetical protein KJ359_002632 [Pestalotiopsis sp. 9143b]|nr:hypothetical protein KJ359_002632 [Pestalotiopsis sp. 9143b]